MDVVDSRSRRRPRASVAVTTVVVVLLLGVTGIATVADAGPGTGSREHRPVTGGAVATDGPRPARGSLVTNPADTSAGPEPVVTDPADPADTDVTPAEDITGQQSELTPEEPPPAGPAPPELTGTDFDA